MKSLKVFLGLLVLISLAACNIKPTDRLVGNWQKENGSETLSFLPDGKAKIVTGPATISTTYQLSGPDTIEFNMGQLGTGILKYSLSKDGLVITDSKGNASKYIKEEGPTAEKSS